MIKRRFYKEEHGDANDPSSDSSSSSSSDSEVEVEVEVEAEAEAEAEATEESDGDAVADPKDSQDPCSTSSGYESEYSSANEIDGDPSGFMNEDDETANDRQLSNGSKLLGKHGADVCRKESCDMVDKESVPADVPDCILKCKSVFKCRICPRIVCLNEESMRVHLNSKRHARSEKLLKENRLKAVLGSNGEIENQETPAEMHARIVALAQEKPSKKSKGRQRQRKRARKKKVEDSSEMEKGKSTKIPSKKRRKNKN